MAKPGPRPTPSAIRRAAGQRSDRLNPSEPVPARSGSCPEPPDSLCPEAQAKWWRLAPDLYRAGVLTSWDVESFAAYCDLAVQVERTRGPIAKGLLAKGRRDEWVTNPLWRIHRDALKLLRVYALEFGLTPASRSQLRVLPPAPPHEKAMRASQTVGTELE